MLENITCLYRPALDYTSRHFCTSAVGQRMDTENCLCMCAVAPCWSIKVMLGLPVWLLSQVRVKEVSQEALNPGGLWAPGPRHQRWIQSHVQGLCGVESRAGLRSVETLDGAGQPDEPLETLDASATVVHQLVLAHSSTAAGRGRRKTGQIFHPSTESDSKYIQWQVKCIYQWISVTCNALLAILSLLHWSCTKINL